MRIYDRAMLHATNKQNTAPGKLGEVVSLDLGNIPEDVISEEVAPLIKRLSDVLEPYRVYPWLTMGYHEDKDTDNEV